MIFFKVFNIFYILQMSAFCVDSKMMECESRHQPINGESVFKISKNWNKAVEVYRCHDGYVLIGYNKQTCMDGKWSGLVPLCIPNGNGSLDKNFSSAHNWFSFRHILNFNKTKHSKINVKNIKNTLKKKYVDVKAFKSTAHTMTFQKDMIRNSNEDYSLEDYDMSCLFPKRFRKKFIKAPSFSNARVKNYIMKRNNLQPYNKYIEAIYSCIDGYVLENNFQNKLFCRRRRWIGLKPACKTNITTVYFNNHQVDAYIKCPPEKNLTIPEGKKSIDFIVEPPETNYNWQSFGSLSFGWSKVSPKSLVPGLYVITYSIQNEDIDIVSCRTSIRVIDKEPPQVYDCPLYLEISELFIKNDVLPIVWQEPTFLDNVGVSRITKSMESGELLHPGSYNVSYTALDDSGNTASCNFILDIKNQTVFNIAPASEVLIDVKND
ncbi:sushi, von Willebrand factor type A, EGF and pentraxin domain-containing protein 1-like isoform X2 [Daktulosphaira vitifoliae]|uniref:sushi, von Willebrand factor type A, EGF and pentraxin domain-containing protein 1-like isoform X2 n=1 Tax=Daktulosphaira vitifoliae TaxID=58002 RepID=UPI0021A97FF0|nr:sushi, von Willebrand factor type A, EGF and pentraxin domain-containing protein 1-like isoform X2 [Daktulosphaira vitifoliae]